MHGEQAPVGLGQAQGATQARAWPGSSWSTREQRSHHRGEPAERQPLLELDAAGRQHREALALSLVDCPPDQHRLAVAGISGQDGDGRARLRHGVEQA